MMLQGELFQSPNAIMPLSLIFFIVTFDLCPFVLFFVLLFRFQCLLYVCLFCFVLYPANPFFVPLLLFLLSISMVENSHSLLDTILFVPVEILFCSLVWSALCPSSFDPLGGRMLGTALSVMIGL